MSNFTLPTIQEWFGMSDGMEGFLIFISLVIIGIALLGNLTVIVSSVFYRALGLDQPMTFLLEVLACCDILVILIFFMPKAISLMAGEWILGDFLCGFTGLFAATTMFAQIMVTTVLGCYRAFILSPLYKGRVSMKLLRRIVVVVLILSNLPIIIFLSVGSTLGYAFPIISCSTDNWVNERLLSLVVSNVPIDISIILLTLASIYIVVALFSSTEEKHKNRNVLVVLIIAAIFVLTHVSSPVWQILNYHDVYGPNWVTLFHMYIATLNSVVNPIIYLCVNKYYRRHLISIFNKDYMADVPEAHQVFTEAETEI